MRLGILGTLLVVADNGEDIRVSAGRQRAVLATLIVHANRPVSPDVFAELVWEGAPPVNYATTLRNYVMRLRRTLGGSVAARIETREPGYLLRAEEPELDLLRFEALCRSASEALRAEAWSQASDAAGTALSLWRDTPLLDVPSQTLRDSLVPRLEQLRVQALEDRAEAGLRLGRHEQLVADLREAVAAHPLRERLHTQLILALYRSRRQAEALAAYRDARKVLVAELGIEPGPELRRLHERILAGDAEPSAPSPPVGSIPRPRPATVPRQLPSAARHFTGRRDELDLIGGLVDSSQCADVPGGAVVISAIDGTAGIGKSALAIHAAHRLAGGFPDGQLYIDLRGFDPSGAPMAAATAVRRFLDAFAVPAARIPQDLHAQIDLYRSVLADKRVLLVLDNARDSEQVRPLLPGAAGSMVLVTSRNRLAGLVAREGAVLVTLDLLTPGEARDLLTRRLGAERVAREERAVGELIELCARLPLALNLAAAHAALYPHRPLEVLNRELRDGRRRLEALAVGDDGADVRAVFSWSYTALGPDAARMFRLLGMHPGSDISLPAAASMAAVDHDLAGRLLGELAAAHLVTEHPAGRYVLHDLLRAYAAEQSRAHDTEEERRQALRRTLSHYLHTAATVDRLIDPGRDQITLAPLLPGVVPETPDDLSRAWQWYEAEYPTLHAAVARAAEEGLDAYAWQIPWALANLSFRRGHWHEQIDTQLTAVQAAGRLGDQEASALAHRILGRIHTRLGDYPQAQKHLRHALDLFEQTGNRVGQAHTHRAMAWVLERQGYLSEALDCAQQALRLFRAADHRTGQASALNATGWLHTRLGEHRQALTACAQALALHREAGDRDGEATALESLGRAHHHLGRHLEAITYYEQALPLLRETGARYFEADTLAHLGDAHRARGNTDTARTAWRQALAILDDLHHPDAEAVRAKLLDLDAGLDTASPPAPAHA